LTEMFYRGCHTKTIIPRDNSSESTMNTEPANMIPARNFLRMCRRNMGRAKIADSTGLELTGADMLTRTLIVRRVLRRELLADDEQYVGLLLPPSVAGVITNVALTCDRRVSVNLNYTVSSDVMNNCISQCGIRHVLTSRKVMEKLDLELDAEVVCLEDLREKVTLIDKVVAAAQARCMPLGMLESRLGIDQVKPDDLLTVIFTSGSTGQPKGVMLTHENVGANVDSFQSAINLTADDVLIGILPLFHSFGYTATMWTALMLEPKVVYHYSPLEPRPIGKLCQKHGATIMIATPTFLRSYIRRCQPEEFAKMEVVLTGAEKLPVDVVDAFEKKFGVRPIEGYGATELSPVATLNVPPERETAAVQQGCKEGTIGRPIPGMEAKIVDIDSGEDLGPDQSGMLLIKGPSVMKGYLDRPELTAKVIKDGWYITGDVAMIDQEGFVHITGRMARFSKIGGEMVPHIHVEEAIGKILQEDAQSDEEDDDEEKVELVVSAVPHPKKGERLVVLYTGLSQSPEEMCRRLSEAGLPPIWIPSPDSFRQIDEIPVLGTGKLDLRAVKDTARREFPSE